MGTTTKRSVGSRKQPKSPFVIGDKMGVGTIVKIGDYVKYKMAGYYPRRHGTVIALQQPLSKSGHQAKVHWCDTDKVLGTVWEWCDHLKVIATTETKCQ